MEILEITKRLERANEKQQSLTLQIPQNKIEILKELYKKRTLMSDDEILTKAHHIHLVMRGNGQEVWISTKNTDNFLFFVSGDRVSTASSSFQARPLIEASNLKPLGSITTYHSYGGYRAFLRPSIDEAIWQCPLEWLDKATAFEFSFQRTDKLLEVYDGDLDLHVLKTTYYQGEIPEIVKKKIYYW